MVPSVAFHYLPRAMRPLDTHPAAHEMQLRAYRAMGPERRTSLMFEMSEDVRRMSREAIQRRHPSYSEAEVHRAFVALLHGADIAGKIWPGVEIPRP